ncbi:O-antigen ligase family protein [Flavobacterium sp.]|uniref:O-antigen ligase family protein n=1 Tax=Flavobacterium sp. TaxID=239 RepID=UPI0038FC8D2C
MKKDEILYLYLIAFHAAIGMIVFIAPFLSLLYGFSIVIFGAVFIIKKENKNNEALIAAAYVVGSEVFLRMTGGNPLYEISKYSVIIFLFIGMIYTGFSKNATPYWLFILLLIPGVILSTFVLNYDAQMRKTIAFNISGPVCLGIASIYTYRRKISLESMNSILLSMGLPIISMMVYLIFYAPNVRDIVTGTSSNLQTSGGFGPNQVSTIMGLGVFIFFSRIILESKTRNMVIINISIAFIMSYRGIVTFSRGGMFTGFFMIVLLLFFLYFKSSKRGRLKLNILSILLVVGLISVWTYSSYQTSGLIEKRYANKDALGRSKKSNFSGREEIAKGEWNTFLKNPFFGVGVGKGVEARAEASGKTREQTHISHDEITRMLSEHGTLGIIGLLILFFTPLVLYLENKFNMYLLCFVLFWIMTINHAAMRIAAPAFVYSLSLLNINLFEPSKKKETEFE